MNIRDIWEIREIACNVGFIICQLGILPGFYIEWDESTSKYNKVVRGPSTGLDLINNLEHYWTGD